MQMAFHPGDKLLHYRLVRKLGEGGMGVVFEAEDIQLQRTVAIKVLQPAISEDHEMRERFLREARAASAIDHPNLCTIYTVETAPDGSLLLVMAYYRGHTLSELIQHGPMDISHIRDIGRQTAAGLHAAHMSGIVHRDIKPGNIFLLNSGTVKILDFGLSRIAHQQQLTAPHKVMGTLAYMPPEQLAGDAVDYRTDIWALGVVLYEMAAGHSPFRQATQSAMMTAIAAGRYVPLHHARPDLPDSIYLAVSGALRLHPHERHASAAEILALLSEAGDAEAMPSAMPALVSAASLAPTVIGSFGGAWDIETKTFREHPAGGTGRTPFSSLVQPGSGSSSIAVLPMRNVSSDPENEYFSDGLTDELINALGTLPGLHVVSRTSVFSFKGKHQNIREIGEALNVDVVLEGSVRRSGARIRITIQLTDARKGFHIWSSRFDRENTDVFELQDELATAVVSALQEKLSLNVRQSDLQTRAPMQTDAYEAYLKGRYHWGQRTIENIQLAGRYFEQALKLDPNSAAAYAGVADFYCLQGTLGLMAPDEAWSIARSSALQAVALDPNLPEGHLALAAVLQFYDWDWNGGREHIVRAIELRPQRGESYFLYVSHLMTQGQLLEALEQARIGLTYDPLATPLLAAQAMLRTYLGDHDSTILLAKAALASSPHYYELYYSLGLAQSLTGRTHEAVATFERGIEHSGMPVLLGWLAEAHAKNGNHDKAREVLANLLDMASRGNPMPVSIAVAAAALGENELAFTWLEKAAELHDIFVAYVTVLPSLKRLHNEPRYQRLLDRMKLAHPSTHRRHNETRKSAVDTRS
ncbi:protein kinase domain-containing protein [Acidipila rosea]|uniref:Serine/threonine-protein kinase n=1 Tax=Acidipila rosea TaxID=768535 RepID=A0A4R1LGM6_9BACT|nr:serine/threonine-protein kinase [Acidipila rosea]